MATWTPEAAFEDLRKHRATIEGARSANEATTRLRAIDTMLFDVLHWDRLVVVAEVYCRAEGYADYGLKDGHTLSLMLEAKKAGTTFVLPDRQFGDRPIGFPLLATECPAAELALRQALGYAATVGSRYVAITNGHQWLLTLTFVQNQPLEERSVFVFESLDAIEQRFRSFWNCFSADAIHGNRPADALLESRKAPAPQKLSQHIHNYPLRATRNVIANELSAVTALVLKPA